VGTTGGTLGDEELGSSLPVHLDTIISRPVVVYDRAAAGSRQEGRSTFEG
jgi:hypothetical protein